MGYYDVASNVEEYLAMAAGHDGRELVARLRRELPEDAEVLELGMGPGNDLDLLAESFRVTGSDSSQLFLDRYRQLHPQADLLRLDARSLDTERRFDAVYSNKVLQHLTPTELTRSLARQRDLLRPGGLLLHSLWHGDRVERHNGLLFVFYTEASVAERLPDGLVIAACERYDELETGDSLLVVLREPS